MRWLEPRARILWVLSFLAFLACTRENAKPDSPEAALERYVSKAFNAKSLSAKQELLDLSSGDARAWLETMPDETFRKQFVENSMVFHSMKTKDLRQDKNGDVSLVYELSFRDGKAPSAAAYTNRKIAFLTKSEKGEWKIKATKNIKSVIERKDDLEVLTPETTDKNPEPEGK